MLILGWGIVTAGTALWTFGYLTDGTRAFVDWSARMPFWIADFLPNMESEIGLVLVLIGMVAIYWQKRW